MFEYPQWLSIWYVRKILRKSIIFTPDTHMYVKFSDYFANVLNGWSHTKITIVDGEFEKRYSSWGIYSCISREEVVCFAEYFA